MFFSDTYKTIASASTGIYKEKASKFLSFAYPVSTEDEVKEFLKSLKKDYFDANHHCFAFQLGFNKDAFRMSDDGEPSGTAGRPIYGQIQRFDLTNIMIAVVRYFGGTKLGASGLLNAYRVAAQESLLSAHIIEKIVYDYYIASFPYQQTNDIMKYIKERRLNVVDSSFDLRCRLNFSVRRRDSDKVVGDLRKKEGIEIQYQKTE